MTFARYAMALTALGLAIGGQPGWSQSPASGHPASTQRTWLVTGRLSLPGGNPGLYGALVAIPTLGAGTVAGTIGEFRLYARGRPGCHELVIQAPGYTTRYLWLPLGRDSVVELGVFAPAPYDAPPGDPTGERPSPPVPADTVARCQPPPRRADIRFPVGHAVIQGRVVRGAKPLAGVRVWPWCGTPMGDLTRDPTQGDFVTDSSGAFRLLLSIRFPHNLLLGGGYVPCHLVIEKALIEPPRFALHFGPIGKPAPVTPVQVAVPEPVFDLNDPLVAYDSLLRSGTVLFRFGVLSGGFVAQRGRLMFEAPEKAGRLMTGMSFALRDTIRRTASGATIRAGDWVLWERVRPMLPAIRINTGGQRTSMGAALSLVLPDSLDALARAPRVAPDTLGPLWALARVPLRYGHGPAAYRLLPTAYDTTVGVLRVELHAFEFDDERTLDHSNEALIVIARVAGVTSLW